MIKQLVLTIFFSITAVLSMGQTSYSVPSETWIDTFIVNKMDKTGIVGIGASIIIDKKPVWTKGYGYADKESKTPFTPSTIVNVASVSKTFTGVCIMKAAEEGKVTLDEDINAYLPFKVVNPSFPNEKITLRHLATHTSGLTDRQPFYTDSTGSFGGRKIESLGSFLKNYLVRGGKHYSKDNFLNTKPGAYREYSNIGAGLAGYIVELSTGKKLNEYAKQHIFKPLKMANSGWFLNEVNIDKHSKLYRIQRDSTFQIELYEGTTYPDGGVRTSTQELSKFFISLLNEGKYESTKILRKESVEEMLRFQYTEKNKPDNVKLSNINQGIFWATKLGGTRIGHNGSDPGVRVFMLSDLNKEIAVILFFNTELNDEGTYFDIYEELYKYGKELKATSR